MIVLTPVMMVLRVLSQTVVLALVQIFNNKIRTFLTTLGIIVAVASIILRTFSVAPLASSTHELS